MAFAVSGAALGGAVRAPRLTGDEEGSLVFRRTGGARVGGSGTHGAMRAAAASGKAVVVPEGENDGITSKADSAQFQSDELETRRRTRRTRIVSTMRRTETTTLKVLLRSIAPRSLTVKGFVPTLEFGDLIFKLF
ncbi:1,4-alpha-glucan-branching enzyme 2, chloroplastic/amyloplastic-like isoform X2 [Miscanthus floridulus]|uniref:1,4-alpha-glucan-branching enzyme 2, chloroplastic/amyloplastic-like isoform X2 n=1 Tax=Miscanthus floridulus TaxID=154761 RepID=UPI00345B0E33